jgi:hypothetical protein
VSVLAGIDVGNATTEVVLARAAGDGIEVITTGRAPTRRAKGSPESLDGAATLVGRLERQHAVRVERAVAAPLRPVATAIASLPEERADTGRLWLAKAGASTAGGRGVGVGRPVRFGEPVGGEDAVVVAVPGGTGYREVAAALAALAESGRLAAVLLADDEAVLVANRLPVGVPVVDEVDVEAVLAVELLAVEVSEDGRPLQMLPDPLKLGAALGLGADEVDDAARLAPLLFDSTNAVVGLGGAPAAAAGATGGWIEVADERLPFLRGHERVRSGSVGAARRYGLPPDGSAHVVDDLWTVDLAEVAAAVHARRGGARSRPVSLAALRRDAPYVDPAAALSDRLGVPVDVVPSEAAAARAGGLSTPGAGSDAVVVDLGGGTIDCVSASSAIVAAGAGELLTTSVAALTGATAAAAEWVKRGPAHRVDAPQILLAEDGSRGFLERPAPPETIGSLVVRGPAGLLAFSTTMAPGEWRALRLRLKTDLVGGNVARALRSLEAAPRTVVVVGGSAGDDEVLAAVSGALPPGTAVGRGDVAGALGHRYAVAYGLLLLRRQHAGE